jgi:hypothetical protein
MGLEILDACQKAGQGNANSEGQDKTTETELTIDAIPA